MKIEPNIIDGKTEKEGLYTDTSISTLQERLDTISFQLDSINLQLSEKVVVVSADEKARLLAQKSELENEKTELEQKITELKEQEKEELTDVHEDFGNYRDDTSYGLIHKDVEFHSTIKPLYTAKDIGKASVPVANMKKKQEERKVENETVRNEIRSSLGAKPSKEQLEQRRARLEEWRNSPEYQQCQQEVKEENARREEKKKKSQGLRARPKSSDDIEK